MVIALDILRVFCGVGFSVYYLEEIRPSKRYGLDGPGFEPPRERDFLGPSRPTPKPIQPPVKWIPGIKRPGRGADHPPPPSAGFENG
jgi:hypothetical protein